MERASKLIRGLSLPGNTITPEEIACAAWSQAVGKRIATHTRAIRLVRTRMVVEVEDRIWQRQLMALSGQILRNLEKGLGTGCVGELEFRIVPRRREPQRATQAMPLLDADESDAISDPVLRGIYRTARKRAQA